MKTKISSLLIIGSFSLLSISKVSAQAGCFSNTIPFPTHTEVQSANSILDFTMEPGVNPCNNSAGPALTGIGMNQSNPQYMLDILCDPSVPTNGDVNISNKSGSQNVGYRIGGNMVLWHNGITSDIYVGVNAGNNNTVPAQCTFVGNNAGNANAESASTAVGYHALKNNTHGLNNTAVGVSALETQAFTFGGSGVITNNTAVGYQALFTNNPTAVTQTGIDNTAMGEASLYANAIGSWNSGFGQDALNANTGSSNTALGCQALLVNNTGGGNTSVGTFSSFGNLTGSFNTVVGAQSFQANTSGSWNTAIGPQAMGTNVTGSFNTVLGYQADVANGLQFATAIGGSAAAAASFQMELGDNDETVTIGRSGLVPTTPVTKLELNTDANNYSPFNIAYNTTAPSYINGGSGTGWSGLRFDNLTSGSTAGTNPGTGYLSLDASGNVVYVTPSPGGTGIGYCSSLMTMTGSGGYDMGSSNVNFIFAGNGTGDTAHTDVVIGNDCSHIPQGKLDVFQNSGSTVGSTGVYVENDDVGNPTRPVIGLKSIMGYTPCFSSTYPKAASWFESEYCPTPGVFNYAIYVPWISTTFLPGIESIGYSWGYYNSYGDWLQVVTDIYAAGVDVPSDRKFKQDFTPIKNPMGKIDSLKPTYFYFDTTGRYNAEHHFSSKHQVGFIAQNVDSVLPEAVKVNDSNEYAMDYAKMTPLIVAGMQQQQQTIDSMRHTNDSLRYTLDSLRSAFQNFQDCLNRLCQQEGVTRPRNGDGNGTSSNNANPALNTQDITLSASTGAPLLYQNMPNPFGTGGTKINYYLPDGTIGASVIFYDTYGNMLKTVQLSQTGNGTLNITPDNLANGIYSYSLIVNGAVVDTKKMLLQK